MKDLLIGAVDLLSWEKIQYWAKSIRQTNFDGDIILIVYRGDLDILSQECSKLNIALLHATHDRNGEPINHQAGGRHSMAWQIRFFHIWQYLSSTQEKYRYVITTDVRDVIFQENPSRWFDETPLPENSILAPSEGIAYGNEPWGLENVQLGYGPYILEEWKNKTIYNIGTIAGHANALKDFCLILYSMGENRYVPSDQSSFNLLVQSSFVHIVKIEHDEGWACQCGTTIDPSKMDAFRPHLRTTEPLIINENVCTSTGKPYYIVHQWDRIPQLKQIVERKYL